MQEFCKLFETADLGQILVKIDRNEEGIPEVRFYAQPEDCGVCSVAVSYTDDDAGWDKAEEIFAKVDVELASTQVSPIFKMAAG